MHEFESDVDKAETKCKTKIIRFCLTLEIIELQHIIQQIVHGQIA
jgi:hypothetical protein